MAMMDIDLLGTAFTDLAITDAGSAAFALDHDWFTAEDLTINTAAGGAGTALVLDTDFSLTQESTDLSSRVTAAVGSDRNVYNYVTIVTESHQTGVLYFSGKYIADSVAGEDVEYREIKILSSADYTVRDADRVGRILVTTGASSRTVTLPTAADNAGRQILIMKVDSGSGEVAVDGEGAEKLYNQDLELTILDIPWQGMYAILLCDGSAWRKINGPSIWYIPYAVRTNTLDVNGTSGTANVWSSAVTMSLIPLGTLFGLCYAARVYSAGYSARIAFERASGTTGADSYRYFQVGAEQNVNMTAWIPVDAAKQYKWVNWTYDDTDEIGAPVAIIW